MLSVSVGLIHPTGLFGVEQGKHPSVLVNFQLANENAVSSLPGTGEEASLGLQSWWDTPLEIPPMILYVPWHCGCSICGTRARSHGETEAWSKGRQVIAQTKPARSAGHIAAMFPGSMGDARGLGDVVCWPTLVMRTLLWAQAASSLWAAHTQTMLPAGAFDVQVLYLVISTPPLLPSCSSAALVASQVFARGFAKILG